MHHLPLAKATFSLLLLPPHPPPSTVAFFCTLHFHLAGRSNNHQNAATNSTPLCSARAYACANPSDCGVISTANPKTLLAKQNTHKTGRGKNPSAKERSGRTKRPRPKYARHLSAGAEVAAEPVCCWFTRFFAPVFRRTVKCADVKKRSNTQPMNFYAS